MFEVGVARTFHALHQLEAEAGAEAGPEPHDHEHDYRVEAVVRGAELAPESGWLLNLDELGAALTDCLAELDSTRLDDLATFAGQATTVEVVADHIWGHVSQAIDAPSLQSLRVTVYESADAWAAVDRPLR
jgi:6-pyruvoyl-tetrahydropterin synthase